MAVARALRVVLTGKYHTGSFAGEIWQTGTSFVEGDAGGVFPNAIRQSLPQFDVTEIGETVTDATFNQYWAWKGNSKVTQANQVAIANAAVAMFTAWRASITSQCQLVDVRIYAQDALGKVINGGNVFELVAPISGTGSSANQLPLQLAVVASLRTGARGAGGRGRMYLPLIGVGSSSGKIGAATTTAAKTSVVDYLQAVRGIGPLPAVVNAAKQTYSAITRVETGDLYDVQRRRANGLTETYTGQNLNLT